MKTLLLGALVPGVLVFIFGFTAPSADAHRSGCHRWHSCPSDTGSYTCGDLGYCSQCSDNEYCHAGAYAPGRQKAAETQAAPKSENQAFVGTPRSMADLLKCEIVGNYNSMIYHLKGSSFIRKMSPTHKE